jgi:signal transduction histidine kinase
MTMTERSEYVLEPLREGADSTVYRGRRRGNAAPILAIALCADQPSPQSLRRLEHEHSLAAELDPAWAAKPLTITHHEGRTIFVLEDPGGEPLDQVLEREEGQPLDLTRFLRTAIGMASALGQVHRRGLIHKDIKPANVNEVIGEMVFLLRSEAIRYNISVRTDLAADLPQVMGDRVQLPQVLMNLMVNGIDAMKDVDGTRELAIQSRRTENDQLLVSVSDTGVGLPPQHADQIFNAFFTTKSHGTGMGLPISRSIVESHGGRLWAVANAPRGANFYFTLSASTQVHP